MSLPLVAARLALAPVLLPQARRVRRDALRLPEAAGARGGVVGEGARRLDLLVVGDSSAAGVGVADQAQALALPLAQHLQQALQGAVGWQLVARTGVSTREARALLAEADAGPADVLVTALGVNDVSGQTSAPQYVRELEQLWDEARRRTGARWMLCCGLPPMHLLTALPHPLRWYLGRYADWLDQALQHWTREHGLGYLSLRWAADPGMLAEDGFHPGPALYPQWAQRLAQALLAARPRWERA